MNVFVCLFVGWFNTYDRALTVDFTTAFRKPLLGVFFVKSGNPNGFQWTDLTGKKIAFDDGSAQDEHCLARMGDKITVRNSRYLKCRSYMLRLIQSISGIALAQNSYSDTL